MEKRWVGAVLAAAICLAFAGCSKGEISSVPDLEQGPYPDGSYEVRMPQDESGWQEYGKITVADGYITAVEYDAGNEAGDRKSQDAAYRDSMAAGNAANGLPAVYPEKVYSDLIADFRAAQYDPQKVDAVAGATVSSRNFQKVMAALMELVEKGQPGEVTLPLYEDGVYEVEMPEYDGDWKDFICVTISAGQVDSIVFDARNEQGDLKSADESYRQKMIAGNAANGLPETYPADYAQKLEENYLQTGSVETMDGVAGATISSRNFKKLLGHALANAKKGDTALAVAPLFENGEYRAQISEADDEGWSEFVVLTIQDNAISQISFDAVDENGAYQSKDADYQKQMEQAGADKSPAEFHQAIIQAFIDAKYLPDQMETIAGATQSCQNFKKLVVAALENALYGSEEVAIVEAQ